MRKERYVSWLLWANIVLYVSVKDGLSLDVCGEQRKIREIYQRKIDNLKREMQQKLSEARDKHSEELQEIESWRVQLDCAIKDELGEQYNLLDICKETGHILRDKG